MMRKEVSKLILSSSLFYKTKLLRWILVPAIEWVIAKEGYFCSISGDGGDDYLIVFTFSI